VFNAYCWIHSTYFVTGAMLGVAGVNVAFPGVGASLRSSLRSSLHHELRQRTQDRRSADALTRQLKYYQWVPLFLGLQVSYRLWHAFLVPDLELLASSPSFAPRVALDERRREFAWLSMPSTRSPVIHIDLIHGASVLSSYFLLFHPIFQLFSREPGDRK
jgi:hypothetical protein